MTDDIFSAIVAIGIICMCVANFRMRWKLDRIEREMREEESSSCNKLDQRYTQKSGRKSLASLGF